jgi:hypothetical protein
MTVILAAHVQRVKNTHFAIEDGSLVLQKRLAISIFGQ